VNSEKRHVVCTGLSEAGQEYYTGQNSYEALRALSGSSDPTDSREAMQNNQLFDALRGLMRSKLVKVPVYAGFQEGSLAITGAG